METESTVSEDSTLLKAVELIAITPADARAQVESYRQQIVKNNPDLEEKEIIAKINEKIIDRYSSLAAVSGGTTSLAGIIPGIGTALSIVGGGMADVTICMKLQIDMAMSLVIANKGKMTNEDAKHLSFFIAVAGGIEQLATSVGAASAKKAAERAVAMYLKGVTLQVIKEMFKKFGIIFTQKAAQKAIPFGVGVIIGAGVNYALTKWVGSFALDTIAGIENT
ncbi:hypothetical protein [Pseudomonas aeruginosa]|uniref:hypothetical protein n=1 Tax=Pseudomonas aeruginosa TaxID=287 RepID=UPI0009369DBA|nr:hypothetical protein [Pseudomonas aeruginosa]MCM8587829.1 EcsC family protein [Pseudomonas aeruginosa]MCM8671740.1 EcsC family protein [Pseudomonas aeruginosa]MCP2651687.1 EcsC family protein [Pseudomonas aeruginosa]RUC63405.1 hypothetical protein IPC1389_17300 [Pseudomonas aeruginosa]WBH34404.1 hypothetical protein PALA4_03081 [Pseudomonas aeruginosa]